MCPLQVRHVDRHLVICICNGCLHATVVVVLFTPVSAHYEDHNGHENGDEPRQGTDDDTDDVTSWCLLFGSFLWL
ncbi:hypothetical protein DPMN_048958 [Dreissena polymorpha]|uniref:Uncharacterized protein n=1 Tax=Dreissena polymorpha TaxID=45954 RepID=A0A9D4DDB2_DREPO|nr:hypothetical protein DPMN_048958 [Dreissena polymorpha]